MSSTNLRYSLYFLSTTLLFLVSSGVDAQNLVPNPGFEYYSPCPRVGNGNADLHAAVPWFSPLYPWCSSDYYHECSRFYQYQMDTVYPCTGNGYTRISLYSGHAAPQGYAEYLEVKLKESLQPGRRFCLSLYYHLQKQSTISHDGLGALFTEDSVLTDFWDPSQCFINRPAQVINPPGHVLSDTVWTKFSGSFVASGGEQFVTIGRFTPRNQLTILVYNDSLGHASAHFFDDIAVYPCDAPVYSADAGISRLICPGDSMLLGGHNLPEYLYAWFRAEYPSDTLSTQAHLWVKASDTIERYVLRVKDFKFDETYDTVSIIPSFTACRPAGFTVYPNPTNYDVTFEFDNLIPPLLEITFYNILGQPVLLHRPAITYETRSSTVLLEHLPAGVYTYSVRIDRQPFPRGKIVLVK